MDQPEEGEQPRQEPWGRLLRLGAEEGEPYIPLWKREWTIGRRRGCDLSFPGNKLVSGDHCKIIVDEKSGQVSLQDTSTNGTVINKLKIVKRQTCPLQTGDVIYVVYRKNEPEHNVAYLYESLKEKQGVTPESFGKYVAAKEWMLFGGKPLVQVSLLKQQCPMAQSAHSFVVTEANKENVFLMTEDTSGAGSGGDTRALPPPPATPVCFEEPQPSTSTSNLFHTASTSSSEPASLRQEHPSASGPGGVGLPSQGCGPAVAGEEASSSVSVLPDREGRPLSLEPQGWEDWEPTKKKMKGDGEASPGPPLLVADPCQDPPAGREDSRAEAVKPDRMEETLTCIICQELLHDCVSLQPCMHTFCAACYSGWMERSSLCPTCRCLVERICKNHMLNNLVEAYLTQHPDKGRTEEDVQSMDARNKIIQDMLQPKVRRSFSDEEGSSEDLLELSDVDSESSDISQPYIVCRQCPESRRQAQPFPCLGPEGEQGSPQAPGDTPSTSASLSAAQDYVCPAQGSHAVCTCCFQPMPDRRAEREQDPRVAPQQCECPFCGLRRAGPSAHPSVSGLSVCV